VPQASSQPVRPGDTGPEELRSQAKCARDRRVGCADRGANACSLTRPTERELRVPNQFKRFPIVGAPTEVGQRYCKFLNGPSEIARGDTPPGNSTYRALIQGPASPDRPSKQASVNPGGAGQRSKLGISTRSHSP